MKKLLQALLALLLGALVIGVSPAVRTASATLIYQQHGLEKVVYDTVTDTYWLQDLTRFLNMSYTQQMGSIKTSYADVSYFGISNWHMANGSEIGALTPYFALSQSADPTQMYAFTPTYSHQGNTQMLTHWAGRVDQPDMSTGELTHGGLLFDLGETLASPSMIVGWQEYYDTWLPDIPGTVTSAWVVGTKSAPVPEPASLLLVAVGLAATGLVGGFRRSMLSRG